MRAGAEWGHQAQRHTKIFKMGRDREGGKSRFRKWDRDGDYFLMNHDLQSRRNEAIPTVIYCCFLSFRCSPLKSNGWGPLLAGHGIEPLPTALIFFVFLLEWCACDCEKECFFVLCECVSALKRNVEIHSECYLKKKNTEFFLYNRLYPYPPFVTRMERNRFCWKWNRPESSAVAVGESSASRRAV